MQYKKAGQSKEKAGQQEILNQKIRTVPLKAGQLESMLIPGSFGNIRNKPQEIWIMGGYHTITKVSDMFQLFYKYTLNNLYSDYRSFRGNWTRLCPGGTRSNH